MDANIQAVALQQVDQSPANLLLVQQPWNLLFRLVYAVYLAYGPWSFTLKGNAKLVQDISMQPLYVHGVNAFALTFAIFGCFSPHLDLGKNFLFSTHSMVSWVIVSWVIRTWAVEWNIWTFSLCRTTYYCYCGYSVDFSQFAHLRCFMMLALSLYQRHP